MYNWLKKKIKSSSHLNEETGFSGCYPVNNIPYEMDMAITIPENLTKICCTANTGIVNT